MGASLQGKVAVVTGASRGVGKGIALGLGEAGVIVYLTGRTVDAGTAPLPGTIGETAEQVTQLGGTGIAVRCDHTIDSEVAALFQQIQHEQGRIDILVNNVATLPAVGAPFVGVPFWELPIETWDGFLTAGLRAHYVASRFAAPMMVAQRSGLIVEISSGGSLQYAYNVPYGVGKAGQDRLAADMAHDLQPYGVASVSLRPGLTRTEWVEGQVRSHVVDVPLDRAASPQFSGRAVAALAADPKIMEKTGQSLSIFAIAEEYGLTDIDGSRPQPFRPMDLASNP